MRIKYVFGIAVCIAVIALCVAVITVATSERERTPTTPLAGDTTTTATQTTVAQTTIAQTTVAQTDTSHLVAEILSITENDEWVEAKTTLGAFRYPTALADVLRVEAVSQGDTAALRFVARLAERDITVYTIHYNKAAGIRCGTFKPSDTAEELAVYADLAEAPDDVDADWTATFYAAQETFNDVLSSMAEDSRFTRQEGA